MKLLVCALVSALALAAGAFGGTGAAPLPITAKVLAAGVVAKPFATRVTTPGDVIVVSVKVAPGASFGWHYHPSTVAVAVVSGTLTLYDGRDASCAPQRITAGHGFLEAKGQVHLARNEGTKPVLLVATFIGAPHGQNTQVAAKQPANCSVE
jgi:quercetin dioxygenase-like cupin family protein